VFTGRNAVRAAPIVAAESEADKFILLPENGNHAVAIFSDASETSEWNAPVMDVPSILPTIPEDFLGRNVDMYEVIRTCCSRRLVTIAGVAGVGKTAVSIAVAHYLTERGMFRDGVLHVRLHGLRTTEEMRSALAKCFSEYQNAFGGNPTSAAGAKLASINPSQDSIFSHVRTRQTLLILDHCDVLLESDAAAFVTFLSNLLEAAPSVSLLLTARVSLSALLLQNAESECDGSLSATNDDARMLRLLSTVGEKVCTLNPLSDIDAARLLCKRAARRITPEEV